MAIGADVAPVAGAVTLVMLAAAAASARLQPRHPRGMGRGGEWGVKEGEHTPAHINAPAYGHTGAHARARRQGHSRSASVIHPCRRPAAASHSMDQHPTDDLSVTGHGFPHGYLSPHRNLIREIALTAFFLGVMGAFSVYLILHALLVSGSVVEYALGWYILASGVVFHMAEFLVAVSMRRHDTHPDAFMLLHSPEFLFAMAASYVEFGIEVYLIPEHWKLPVRTEWGGIAASLFRLTSFTQVTVAAVITLAFYGIRVVGLFHCGTNFSLIIESKRRANHNLVVDGIYAWLRHPAYFGWFWRTVVSQWVLMNPICFVGFTIVTWKFFASRIPFEEQLLASDAFFGTTYDAYMSTTIVGIPFIRSWKRQASSVKRD